MLSEQSEAQEIIQQVNSRNPDEKVDTCINRTNPHLSKLSRSEQPGEGTKSIFMTMTDQSVVTLKLHKGHEPEPTSINVRGFTGSQPTAWTVIEFPASGPESAQDAIDRVYEICRQNLEAKLEAKLAPAPAHQVHIHVEHLHIHVAGPKGLTELQEALR